MKPIRLLIILTVGLALTLAALSVLGLTVPEVRAATRTVCPPPGGPGCNDTSIQNAVGAADPGDTIIITAGQYDERVTIPKSLTFQGAGIGQTILHGGQNHALLHITGDNVSVTLIGLTIQDGRDDGSGAGISIETDGGTHVISDCLIANNNATDGDGGGILFEGANNQLNIINSTIRNNSAQPGRGGGIFFSALTSTLQIDKSAVAYNNAAAGGGGLAFILEVGRSSVLTITNSTISGNQVGNYGGGLSKGSNSGAAYLNNVTIANNTANSNNNGSGWGGGILAGGDVTYIANTILAGNVDNSDEAPDCRGNNENMRSQGNNLIEDITGCDTVGWDSSDQLGPSEPVTPSLQSLFGWPPFHPLGADSSAISGGSSSTPGSGFPACEAVDQRSEARPKDSRCDIGAYEYDSSLVIYSVYLPIVIKNN